MKNTVLTSSGLLAVPRAPWGKRVCARLHLLLCRNCRAYCAQTRAIGRTVRERYAGGDSDRSADALIELLKRK